MTTIKNILVATDFEEASDNALRYGRELARRFGATLHVGHVVEDMAIYGIVDGYSAGLGDLQRAVEEEAASKLAALVSEDDRRQLDARTVLLSGAPASALVEYVNTAGIDLLLIGTHGRTGLGHLVMGSVAEKIVRLAPCPVLTVKDREHDFVLPDALQIVAHT